MEMFPYHHFLNDPVRLKVREVIRKHSGLLEEALETSDPQGFFMDRLKAVCPDDAKELQQLWNRQSVREDVVDWDRSKPKNRDEEWRDPSEMVRQALAAADVSPFTHFAPGIPEVDKTFANFSSRDDQSLLAAETAVRAWVNGTVETPMLTLAGIPGTGKTHLAIAAATAVSKSQGLVMFRTEANLYTELRMGFRDQSSDEFLRTLGEVPYLVIDDLGVQKGSEWMDGIRDQLINSRYEMAQASSGFTIVTTNLRHSDMSPRALRRLDEPGVSRVMPLNVSQYRAESR